MSLNKTIIALAFALALTACSKSEEAADASADAATAATEATDAAAVAVDAAADATADAAVAADVPSRSDRRRDHAVGHLLWRDVRRLDDVDPPQHARRVGHHR